MNAQKARELLFAPLRYIILLFGRIIFWLIQRIEYKTQRSLRPKMSILAFILSSAIFLGGTCRPPCTTCYVPAMEDYIGPIVTGLTVEPNPTQNADSLKIIANLEDRGYDFPSGIAYVELFIDSITENGAGMPMNPVDGNFDSSKEEAELTIPIHDWQVGTKRIFVQGLDQENNWGDPDSIDVEVTDTSKKKK